MAWVRGPYDLTPDGGLGEGTALDVSSAVSGAVYVTGDYSGTMNFETSVDGTNWIAETGPTAPSVTAVPLLCKYFRVNVLSNNGTGILVQLMFLYSTEASG